MSRTQDGEVTKSKKCLDLLKLILSGTEWRSAWKILISEYWSLKGCPIFFSAVYTVPLVCQQDCQEFNSGPSNLKLIFLKEEKLCILQNLENHTTKPL